MKLKYIFAFAVVILAFFSACEPRIELDEGQWGDHAYIDNVLLFTLDEEEHRLNEWHTDSLLSEGIRRKILDTNTEIDSLNAVAKVTVPEGADLTQVGIMFSHRSKKIEPLENAPVAGYPDDFTGGPFKYRLISADGSKRDWVIQIVE